MAAPIPPDPGAWSDRAPGDRCGVGVMSRFLDEYRRGGPRPTLADKIGQVSDIDELDGMRAACGARGQVLSEDERAAFARRRAELQKGLR